MHFRKTCATTLIVQLTSLAWCGSLEGRWKYLQHCLDIRFFTVTVSVKSRTVTVTGPRGTLKREFKHLRLELTMLSKKKLKVDVWFANRKELACVKTICSHIENMFKGVQYVSAALILFHLHSPSLPLQYCHFTRHRENEVQVGINNIVRHAKSLNELSISQLHYITP